MGTRDRPWPAAHRILRLVLGAMVTTFLILLLAFTLTSSRPDQVDSPRLGAGHEATAAPSEIAEVTEDGQPEMVPSAENAALEVLAKKYGKECISSGSVTVRFPRTIGKDLDEKIVANDLQDTGWIKEGATWLGDLDSAVEAFGAVEAFKDDDEVWVMLETDLGLVARLMHPIDSESGKTTWRLLDQAAKCGSADPASDDDED